MSSDEKHLVIGGPVFCVYSLPKLQLLSKYGASGGAANATTGDFALSSRGTLVQGAGSTLKILDLSARGVLRADPARQEPRLHLLAGVRVALHPEGWEVATAGGRTAGSRGTGGDSSPSFEAISLFNVDSGDPSGALQGNSHPVVTLAYSPSGKAIASLDRAAELLYFPTRKSRAVSVSREATAFAFLADAALVVGTRSGRAFVFHADQGAPGVPVADLGQPVVNVTTDGGGVVAIQGASGRIILWHRDGACVEASTQGATRGGLAFTPGGSTLGAVPAEGEPVWIKSGG